MISSAKEWHCGATHSKGSALNGGVRQRLGLESLRLSVRSKGNAMNSPVWIGKGKVNIRQRLGAAGCSPVQFRKGIALFRNAKLNIKNCTSLIDVQFF